MFEISIFIIFSRPTISKSGNCKRCNGDEVLNYRRTLIRIRETARSSRTGTTACLPGDHKWQPQSNTGTYCPQRAQCRSPSARGVDCFEASRRFRLRIRAPILSPVQTERYICFLRNRRKKNRILSRETTRA